MQTMEELLEKEYRQEKEFSVERNRRQKEAEKALASMNDAIARYVASLKNLKKRKQSLVRAILPRQ